MSYLQTLRWYIFIHDIHTLEISVYDIFPLKKLVDLWHILVFWFCSNRSLALIQAYDDIQVNWEMDTRMKYPWRRWALISRSLGGLSYIVNTLL